MGGADEAVRRFFCLLAMMVVDEGGTEVAHSGSQYHSGFPEVTTWRLRSNSPVTAW